MGYDLSLSASKLSIYRECTRCFYDANILKIERPRGIVASITNGIDRTMKGRYDALRGTLPRELEAQGVPGILHPDLTFMRKLRHWKSGLFVDLVINGLTVRVIGALDDLLVVAPKYATLDIKSKGDEPRDDGAKYYQIQSDVYGLLLDRNGYPVTGTAYFAYHWPIETDDFMNMKFGVKVYGLRSSPDHAIQTIEQAVAVLQGGQPDANPECEQCQFAQKRVEAALSVIQ